MSVKLNKGEMVVAMANYVRENGLHNASLRNLAEVAGTSDRMLIYYFETKEKITHAILKYLGREFFDHLKNSIVEPEEGNEGNVYEAVVKLHGFVLGELFENYSKVWTDLICEAQNGSQTSKHTGGWIVEMIYRKVLTLLPEGHENPEKTASVMVTNIIGAQVLGVLGKKEIAKFSMNFLESKYAGN